MPRLERITPTMGICIVMVMMSCRLCPKLGRLKVEDGEWVFCLTVLVEEGRRFGGLRRGKDNQRILIRGDVDTGRGSVLAEPKGVTQPDMLLPCRMGVEDVAPCEE